MNRNELIARLVNNKVSAANLCFAAADRNLCFAATARNLCFAATERRPAQAK